MGHQEHHWNQRIGWLRAAVLGANDGIVSTASLIIGVATAGATHHNIIIAGVASLVAGAMSMAAGEYVSVSSQADTEQADLERERQELESNPKKEALELTNIYVRRGLDRSIASKVAEQLMAYDALGAHARDELGIIEIQKAKPIQAALISALTFSIGSAMPLIMAMIISEQYMVYMVAVASLVFLAILGGLSAYAGRASIKLATIRVTFWGALAMLITALVGAIFK